MNAPLVCAITLNWNRLNDTIQCLESLEQLDYANKQILVVDNGSTDGSPDAIRARFPDVEQIVNSRNLGFAGGFNVGLRRALEIGVEFAFIVNNDTMVAADALELLVAAAEPADVGLTAPLIYYADAPDQIWSAGARRNPVTLELTGNHGRGQIFTKVTEREFLSGCGMLIKTGVLERVGLLDERFFMYYEDSDYALRVQQAGFRQLLVPQSRMWHKVSRSSEGRDSPAERYLMGKSSALFFRKHVKGWRWLIIIPYRFGSAIKTCARLLIAGKFAAVRMYWRGLRDGAFESGG